MRYITANRVLKTKSSYRFHDSSRSRCSKSSQRDVSLNLTTPHCVHPFTIQHIRHYTARYAICVQFAKLRMKFPEHKIYNIYCILVYAILIYVEFVDSNIYKHQFGQILMIHEFGAFLWTGVCNYQGFLGFVPIIYMRVWY